MDFRCCTWFFVTWRLMIYFTSYIHIFPTSRFWRFLSILKCCNTSSLFNDFFFLHFGIRYACGMAKVVTSALVQMFFFLNFVCKRDIEFCVMQKKDLHFLYEDYVFWRQGFLYVFEYAELHFLWFLFLLVVFGKERIIGFFSYFSYVSYLIGFLVYKRRRSMA